MAEDQNEHLLIDYLRFRDSNQNMISANCHRRKGFFENMLYRSFKTLLRSDLSVCGSNKPDPNIFLFQEKNSVLFLQSNWSLCSYCQVHQGYI